MIKVVCRNFGEVPGCLGAIDERYTMDFTDVEPDAKIYWCAHCGPVAKAIDDALAYALATRGPEFVDHMEELVDKAMARMKADQN